VADLYRGGLIDDVAVSEEGWSEWLTGERERLAASTTTRATSVTSRQPFECPAR
jgi:hypothetical protein